MGWFIQLVGYTAIVAAVCIGIAAVMSGTSLLVLPSGIGLVLFGRWLWDRQTSDDTFDDRPPQYYEKPHNHIKIG